MRLIREYPLVCAFDKQHCNRAGTVAEEFYRAKKAIPILPRQAFERVIFVSPVR
jgi:hypothetical protein